MGPPQAAWPLSTAVWTHRQTEHWPAGCIGMLSSCSCKVVHERSVSPNSDHTHTTTGDQGSTAAAAAADSCIRSCNSLFRRIQDDVTSGTTDGMSIDVTEPYNTPHAQQDKSRTWVHAALRCALQHLFHLRPPGSTTKLAGDSCQHHNALVLQGAPHDDGMQSMQPACTGPTGFCSKEHQQAPSFAAAAAKLSAPVRAGHLVLSTDCDSKKAGQSHAGTLLAVGLGLPLPPFPPPPQVAMDRLLGSSNTKDMHCWSPGSHQILRYPYCV